MSNWQNSVAGAVETIEGCIHRLKRRLGKRLAQSNAPVIVPYRSYGDKNRFLIRGRVLQNTQPVTGVAEDNIWQNLLSTYRRLESDEVAGARVGVVFRERRAEATTDEEGYFDVWLEGVGGSAAGGWNDVTLQLAPSTPGVGDSAPAVAKVLVPAETTQFGVISDVDDTVMQSYATELIKMAKLALLQNASTRLPFPGVAAFYRALHAGAGVEAGARNPLFYLSSSPWNLYDLLIDFFRLQGIPAGPMFLRDWGITRDELLPTEHSRHKLEAIETLFEFYPGLPFILIGDSGQQDPEIYAEVVRRHSQRVLAVYVRDVSADVLRDDDIMELAKEVTTAGSALILAQDTLVMAQHAAGSGWMEETAIENIAREVLADTEQGEEQAQ